MSEVLSTALFIEVATGAFPLSFDSIKAKTTNMSFGPHVDISELEAIGYAEVINTPIPTGDIVTEGPPTLVDGVWNRTWIVTPFSDDQIADQLTAAKLALTTKVDALRETEINYGLKFSFSDGTTGGVQMRPADRTNLIGLRLQAVGILQSEAPTTTITFRSLENVTRELSATEIVALTDAATAHAANIYALSWALKDEIAAATKVEDLPAIPESLI